MESQALKYYRGNEGNGKENKYHLILRHIRKQEYLSVPREKLPSSPALRNVGIGMMMMLMMPTDWG